MGLTVSASGGKDFENLKPGTHLATCYMVVDIGTHNETYQGKAKDKKKLVIGWEVPGELMENGLPFTISKFYTASIGDGANLRKDLETWRGRPFNETELEGFSMANILGKSCFLSVQSNPETGKTKVASVMALPNGVPAPALVNNSIFFDLDDFDPDVFTTLPNWLQTQINASKERSPVRLEVAQQVADGEFGETANDIPY